VKKKRPHGDDASSRDAPGQDDGKQDDASSEPQRPARRHIFAEEAASLGWPLWLAWGFGLLGLLVAFASWAAMSVAAIQPFPISQSLLITILLGPVIGAALALPGMICALLATRRARAAGAGVLVPLALVSVATMVLIAGLLFGGLVSYPRSLLGSFGQALQAHCARFAQSLRPYGNPPDMSKIRADPVGLVITLQGDQAALAGDQATLNALTAPDPTYQPLLDDCRSLAAKDGQVTSSLLSELVALPPNLTAAEKTITQYQTDISVMLKQIEQLGTALQQQVFAPFQPG
jgi:hypothetical protein